ncbi:MAG: PH domain-containing protein [Alphaproteobacteria bacterium]|nr:MAG: PH domain-containing protein [Alphaproteobacteria bacterium]
MRYVQRVLQPEETIVHQSRLHALIFLPALILLVIALALLVASGQFADEKITIGFEAAAAMFGLLAIASWARAAIRRATTELAVTDRRVIYKSGLFARHTLEMNRSKVESVDVDQSILGRIFGFGTIIVRGTGGSLEPIRLISDPLTFRSHITAS